jgi:hypothetical protein
MSSGDSLCVFTAQSKAQGTATFDTINGNPVLDFDKDADETAIFLGVLPRNYGGNGITATVIWTATPIAGDVVWDLQFERQQDGVTDMSADSFAAAQSVTGTVDGTTEVANYHEITFTNGAQMDSLAVGEAFRIKLNRDANNVADTLVGDASLRRIEIRET